MNRIVLPVGKESGTYYVQGLGIVRVPLYVTYLTTRDQWVLAHPTKVKIWSCSAHGGADHCLLKLVEFYKALGVPIYKSGTRLILNITENKRHLLPVGVTVVPRKKSLSSRLVINVPKKKQLTISIPPSAVDDDSIVDELLDIALDIRREEIEKYKKEMCWKGLYDL